jgi:hypothetical protein
VAYAEDKIVRSDRGQSENAGEPGDALGDGRWLRDVHSLNLAGRTASLIGLRSPRETEKRLC